jgi:hypothetical protein
MSAAAPSYRLPLSFFVPHSAAFFRIGSVSGKTEKNGAWRMKAADGDWGEMHSLRDLNSYVSTDYP